MNEEQFEQKVAEGLEQVAEAGGLPNVETEATSDPSELRRYRAHLAFWAVRAFNPRTQRKKKFRATMTYVRTEQPKGGGYPVVVSRRLGLSGRQWVRRRKEINKLMKARMAESKAGIDEAIT